MLLKNLVQLPSHSHSKVVNTKINRGGVGDKHRPPPKKRQDTNVKTIFPLSRQFSDFYLKLTSSSSTFKSYGAHKQSCLYTIC